jgi:hypothetical protein
MNRPMLALLLAVALLVGPSFAFGQQTTNQLPPRTFPEFAGTWVRDDTLSDVTEPAWQPPVPRPGVSVPGFDPDAQPAVPPEPKLVITTTPTRLTLVRTPAAPNGPDVYRFDGEPTNARNGQGTLTAVGGSLVLVLKRTRQVGSYESITVTTDVLSVSGDVLTIERQYSRIVRPLDGDKVGHIVATDGDDKRVKTVYRRQAAPTQ